MTDYDTPAAVPAAAVRMQTMADGTMRLTVDIEPRHAFDACRMFLTPGTPIALACLTPEAAQSDARRQTQAPAPAQPERRGGQLARLAGMWCDMPRFQEWLRVLYDGHLGGDGGGWGDLDDEARADMTPAQVARHMLLGLCDIESRRELDHNSYAAQVFHAHIRKPFLAVLDQEGAR